MSCQYKIITCRYMWTAYSLKIWQQVQIFGNNTDIMKISYMRKLRAYYIWGMLATIQLQNI